MSTHYKRIWGGAWVALGLALLLGLIALVMAIISRAIGGTTAYVAQNTQFVMLFALSFSGIIILLYILGLFAEWLLAEEDDV